MTFEDWKSGFVGTLFALLGFVSHTTITSMDGDNYRIGNAVLTIRPSHDDSGRVFIHCIEAAGVGTSASDGLIETVNLDEPPHNVAERLADEIRRLARRPPQV